VRETNEGVYKEGGRQKVHHSQGRVERGEKGALALWTKNPIGDLAKRGGCFWTASEEGKGSGPGWTGNGARGKAGKVSLQKGVSRPSPIERKKKWADHNQREHFVKDGKRHPLPKGK